MGVKPHAWAVPGGNNLEGSQDTRLWQRMNFVKEDGLNYPGSGPFLFS